MDYCREIGTNSFLIIGPGDLHGVVGFAFGVRNWLRWILLPVDLKTRRSHQREKPSTEDEGTHTHPSLIDLTTACYVE